MIMKKAILIIACSFAIFSCGSGDEESNKKNPYSTADEQPDPGARLFKTYCVQCHSLDEARIGPPLRGSFAHWDYDTARISSFIRNARETINSGDPRAVAVAEEYNYALMTPMPQLSDEEISALLAYMAK